MKSYMYTVERRDSARRGADARSAILIKVIDDQGIGVQSGTSTMS